MKVTSQCVSGMSLGDVRSVTCTRGKQHNGLHFVSLVSVDVHHLVLGNLVFVSMHVDQARTRSINLNSIINAWIVTELISLGVFEHHQCRALTQ